MPINKVKESFLQQQRHNQQVQQNLVKIEQLSAYASMDEIILHLEQWQDSPVLSMTNTLFWTLLTGALATGLICFYFVLAPAFYLLPVSLMIFAWVKKQSNHKKNELIEQLKWRTLEEKYHINFNTEHPQYSINTLVRTFPLFQLGNYDNKIQSTASGIFHSHQQEFPFTLFHYHYVDKIKERDKDGNVSYRYRHYDRWGIFVYNLPVQGITISNHQKKACRLGQKWTTSDIQFNKKHQLSGNDEMNLARFFIPSRILLLEEILADFKGDLYFHPNLPVMCWQFSSNIFEIHPASFKIDTTQHLAHYLSNLKLSNFERLSQHITRLLEKLN